MNDNWENQLQQDLRKLEEETSAQDVFRLAQARNAALKSAKQGVSRKKYIWPTLGVSLASLFMVAIFMGSPEENVAPTGIANEEFLLDENADLYDDLDFYYWLAETESDVTG